VAARTHRADAHTDRNGRVVLLAMVLVTLVAFVWLVATLATAAFS
jgi:hypothetical protein